MAREKGVYSRNIEIKPGIEFPDSMHRVALGIEYSGTDFRGFQRQASTHQTVQDTLESSLSKIAAEPITLVCAGRTDAGVHATGQVVHFDTLAQRPDKAWVLGANTHLPDGVRVKWVKNFGSTFHARFSATARTYRYIIQCDSVRSAILQKQVTWLADDLDEKLMREGAQYLSGEHDFSTFRAAQCQAHSPVRNVHYVQLVRQGPFIVLEIKANAFLHHMVRNIAGSLICVGRKQKKPGWIGELLAARDRTQAAATASPYGLYLVKVEYPNCFATPDQPVGPIFLTSSNL